MVKQNFIAVSEKLKQRTVRGVMCLGNNYKVSPFRSVWNEFEVMWSLIHLFSYRFVTSQSSLFIWKLKV